MLDFQVDHKNNKIITKLRGDELLNISQLNKGTAFTADEREQFGLIGKLPYRIETLAEQVARAYAQYQTYATPKEKNLYLNELHLINQILFYKLVAEHIEEMAPIIYTPHVATFCRSFSDEFRNPYGLYISYPDKDKIAQILDNRPCKEIDLIVVTDGERILGIGDQGVGGIGIPIGKLMLYSLLGGISPLRTLPIVLDVGTNNPEHINNPNYLGWRHERIKGDDYDNFINDFVTAVQTKLPGLFLHWEDFGKNNASRILERYRKQICSFNDDIQGTAVITLAALLAALKISKQNLADQRIVFFGAGSAAIGIAKLIRAQMVRSGMSEAEATKRFWFVASRGLILQSSQTITAEQREFAMPDSAVANWQNVSTPISLLDTVKNVKPTALIGCSTVKNSFTVEIVKAMVEHVERPIIFPLSNPTANCEATPEELINWTDGRALIATGSPFDPVVYKNKTYPIAQCNNALVYPGIGLGTIASKAKQVTDTMLWAACMITEQAAPSSKDPSAPLLPSMEAAPELAKRIAIAVATQAKTEGLTPADLDIEAAIKNCVWEPNYYSYRHQK